MSTSSPRFLLLRHGQSTANVEGRIASAPEVADRAYGLTETGRDQVRRSVARALELGQLVGGSRVVSSPLLRSRESAEIVAELLGSVVEIDAGLRERGFGTLDLGPDTEYGRVWTEDLQDPGHRNWGVESVRSVLERAASLVGRVAGEGPMDPVVLCTHGDVASTLLCAAAGTALGRHRSVGAMENGEIRPLAWPFPGLGTARSGG